MNMTSVKQIALASVFVLGAATASDADEGHWNVRTAAGMAGLAEPSILIELANASHELTTASIAPRRPMSLAQKPPQTARLASAAPVQNRIVEVAAFAPRKQQPLFWMTVGNGF